jgi:DNA processing protein
MNELIEKILNNTIEVVPTIYELEKIKEKNKSDHAKDYIKLCQNNNISMTTYLDKDYPDKLKQLPDAPSLIFYKGNLSLLNNTTLGVVGSRKLDIYSKLLINDVIERTEDILISGFALGVDIECHTKSINLNKPCVAVLPSGLMTDIVYPKSNIKYFFEIEKRGLVCSLTLPDKQPKPYMFLNRNKLISQLSDVLWTVKAGLKSGTLSTGLFHLKNNKKLLVSPSELYNSDYLGNLELIEKGGEIITNLKCFGLKKTKKVELNETQQNIINLINHGFDNKDLILEKFDYIVALKELNQLEKKSIISIVENQILILDSDYKCNNNQK